jgi:hypothetical protein
MAVSVEVVVTSVEGYTVAAGVTVVVIWILDLTVKIWVVVPTFATDFFPSTVTHVP